MTLARLTLLVLGAVIAACSAPPLQILYAVDPVTCGATTCSDVPLTCGSFLNLRIIRPADALHPLVTLCEPILPNGGPNSNLCAIARIDFPADVTSLPTETLEIQAVVWPDREPFVIHHDDGTYECKGASVDFDRSDGFPTLQQPFTPSAGGRVFVGADDAVATLELGCLDRTELDSTTCRGEEQTSAITASVTDFDTRVSVSAGQAAQLTVTTGEPAGNPEDNLFTLNAADTDQLLLKSPPMAVPQWTGQTRRVFRQYACVQVLQDGSRTTATVACQPAAPNSDLDLRGVRLASATLEQVLTALAEPFPGAGLTIGLVVDHQGTPVAGATVAAEIDMMPAAGTSIRYLSADRMALVTAMTSDSGIFVSDNAVFGTRFRTANPAIPADTVEAVGGGVSGKVTIVVLTLPPPPNGLQ